MKITAFSTGTTQLRGSMAHGRWPRRARLFVPGPLGPELPIHAWLIEHADGLLLIDSGSHAGKQPPPFADFHVTPEDHIDVQLAALGIAPGDLSAVVLTHAHNDHIDGLPYLPGVPQLIGAHELKVARGLMAVAERRLITGALPENFAPAPFPLDDGPVGAFASSHKLTPDGSIRAVPTPGHTPGHCSILIDEGDHDVLIAGDATYSQDQLLGGWLDGVSPSATAGRRTIETIRSHAAMRPTVFLPSHDPDAARRLTAREVVPA